MEHKGFETEIALGGSPHSEGAISLLLTVPPAHVWLYHRYKHFYLCIHEDLYKCIQYLPT